MDDMHYVADLCATTGPKCWFPKQQRRPTLKDPPRTVRGAPLDTSSGRSGEQRLRMIELKISGDISFFEIAWDTTLLTVQILLMVHHHSSFIIHHPSSIIHHPSIHHSSFIIHHSSFIIHHSSFIIHHSSIIIIILLILIPTRPLKICTSFTGAGTV